MNRPTELSSLRSYVPAGVVFLDANAAAKTKVDVSERVLSAATQKSDR